MAHGHGESKYKPGEVAWGAEHHIIPIRVYRNVIILLFLLMLLTIGASYIPFPGGSIVNNLVAMAIAVTKATLVVMFFMHVKFSSVLTRIYAIGGFVWFILLFYIMVDYYTRPWDPAITESWMHDPGSAQAQRREDPTSYPADPHAVNVRPRH